MRFIVGNGGNNAGTNSRRQSNVPRCNDSESVSSLQGSLKRVAESSPKSSQRKQLNRTPLYLSGENSRTTLEQTEALTGSDYGRGDEISTGDPSDSHQHHDQQQLLQLDCVQKKPFAMVRPRRILATNPEYRSFLSTLDLNYNVAGRLRESKSLDVIPNQLRHRIDCKRLNVTKARNRSSCSLDAGVSMISRDPMPFNINLSRRNTECNSIREICCSESDSTTNTTALVPYDKSTNKANKNPYKPLNNNCNGPLAEDVHCPLLYRQGSLNNPQDENILQHKRWRSLETVNSRNDSSSNAPKKGVSRGSIRSWLVNLFQGNGFLSNDVSLRKVGVVQSRVKGFSGFGETLPPAPEHESIV